MLNRYELRTTNRPIDVFFHWYKEGWLELNPPYQRGDVWGLKRRVNLIRSVMIGVPIASVILNSRLHGDFKDGDHRIVVIDGKQRITTILMFLQGQIPVPAEWFEGHCLVDDPVVRYTELTDIGKRKFKNRCIACSEGSLTSIEYEKEVFELVNYGGIAQGEVDPEIDLDDGLPSFMQLFGLYKDSPIDIGAGWDES